MFSSKCKSQFQNFLPIFSPSGVVQPNENIYKCLQKSTFVLKRMQMLYVETQRTAIIKVIEIRLKIGMEKTFL